MTSIKVTEYQATGALEHSYVLNVTAYVKLPKIRLVEEIMRYCPAGGHIEIEAACD